MSIDKNEDVIVVKNVTKEFKVYSDKSNTLKEKIIFKERNSHSKRKVLDDISFTIKKGEAVGLIGHNGCGKSTTLKMLTKIMYPDSGSVKVSGRVSSLLELGAGFHPDMSGRENIYINASIFGLTRKEIDERIEDIIEFSELGAYVDNPVRTYSSGMYMRLAFSVAINVDADVLLVDEILAVGDANFQSKCLQKMRDIKNKGTTIVIVSHSMDQIESICDRSIWLNDGKIVEDGKPKDVHIKYLEFLSKFQFSNVLEKEKKEEKVEKTVVLGEVETEDVTGDSRNVFEVGETVVLKIPFSVKKETEVNIHFVIYREDDMMCLGTSCWEDERKTYHLKNDGIIRVKFDRMTLLTSKYYIDVRIIDMNSQTIDSKDVATKFQIVSSSKESGVCLIDHSWQLEEVK